MFMSYVKAYAGRNSDNCYPNVSVEHLLRYWDTNKQKLFHAFGDKFIGEYDKKIYVWANDGGERVQIAISMTCPKTPIEIDTSINTGADWDWGDSDKKENNVAVAVAEPAEITEEEVDNLKTLLEKLGL